MARRHGRTHLKDQLLAATSRTAAVAKRRLAIADSPLEIFEKFPQARASIRFNKSFLLVTPVT
jgi:hypothetical protein